MKTFLRMDTAQKKLNHVIAVLAASAAFSLIIRTGNIKDGIIKPFDLLITLLGIFAILQLRSDVKGVHETKPLLRYSSWLLVFIVLGQIISWFYRGEIVFSYDILLNYGRATFNILMFLFTALIIRNMPRLYILISKAIFISPIVILPVFFGVGTNYYFSEVRLRGFFQDPNVFGGWMVIIFLIGLGFLFYFMKTWQKTLTVIWLCIIANFILWSGSRASWVTLGISVLIWICFSVAHGRKKKTMTLLLVPLLTFFLGFSLLPNGMKPFIFDRAFGKQTINALRLDATFKKYNSGFVPNSDYGIFSNQTRTKIWGNTIVTIMKSPFSGFGFYYLNDHKFIVQTEPIAYTTNIFLEVLVDGGIGALIAFLLILKMVWNESKSALHAMNDLEFAWFLSMIACLIALSFIDGFLFRYFWFVLGMGLGITWAIRDSEKVPDIG